MKSLSELGISPWPWKAYSTSDTICVDDIKSCIVHSTGLGYRNGVSNVRLIAAAPEMAKVCYDLIMWDGCRDASICDIVAEAKAAYAKASGEVAK